MDLIPLLYTVDHSAGMELLSMIWYSTDPDFIVYLSSFCYVCRDCGSLVVASDIPDKKCALSDIRPRIIATTMEGLKNSFELP
jgi:hypothetical protein